MRCRITLLMLSHLEPQSVWYACLHGKLICGSPLLYRIWQMTHLFFQRRNNDDSETKSIKIKDLQSLYSNLHSDFCSNCFTIKPSLFRHHTIETKTSYKRKNLLVQSKVLIVSDQSLSRWHSSNRRITNLHNSLHKSFISLTPESLILILK